MAFKERGQLYSLIPIAVAAVLSMVIALQLTRTARDRLIKKEAAEHALLWMQHQSTGFETITGIIKEKNSGNLKFNGGNLKFISDGRLFFGQVFSLSFFDKNRQFIAAKTKKEFDTNPMAFESASVQPSVKPDSIGTILTDGTSQGWPSLYSVTTIPIVEDNNRLGSIQIFADQTKRAVSYKRAFGFLTAGLLIIMAFGSALAGTIIQIISNKYQKAKNRVRYLARCDSLTGLMNRASFGEAIDKALANAKFQSGVPPAIGLMWIDLDHFKEVNDIHGHAIGDILLKQVALILLESVEKGDMVARVGGDEFAILCCSSRSKSDLDRLAKSLCNKLNTFFGIEKVLVPCTACIGIAIAPADGRTAINLIKSADLAMYNAKVHDRHGYCFYEQGMHEEVRARRELELAFGLALKNSELQIHYQPQMNLHTRKVDAYEALVRWEHPEKGTLEPSEFVPIAEETGLIEQLGEWTLHKVCKDAAGWQETQRVAVNLSPVQFKNDRILKMVEDALKCSGLEPGRLELEITESLLFHDPAQALEIITALKSMGISIAMDDFGTGYSSLAHLWRFPFDKIKIDRSFIKNIGKNPKVSEIISSIIDLGRALNITITAEGVEQASQERFLRDRNCDYVQGFLYGQPKSNAELETSVSPPQADETETWISQLLHIVKDVKSAETLSPDASVEILKAMVKIANDMTEAKSAERPSVPDNTKLAGTSQSDV